MINLKDFTDNNFLFFDGAFGTMLQKKGLIALGEHPPILNITKSKEITDIHNEYVRAGSHVATTNTFEANRLKLKDSPYTVEEVVKAAVKNARNSDAEYVALDIGPLGTLLEPMGTLSFEEAYDIFKEIVEAGKDADLIILETFSDLLEMKAALLAAKENSDLPVICSMTYNEDNRTFTGTDPITATITLEELGADALGVNCSLGPDELYPVVETITSVANVPVIVQANAGLPHVEEGETVYDISAKDYEKFVEPMVDLGVSIIGGCCGTSPEYIEEITKALENKKPEKKKNSKKTALTSSTNTVFIGDGINVVGERINPTGKPRLKKALTSGSYDYIISEALSQQRQGADILDVNVGLPEIDEKDVLKTVTKEISGITPLPLQIDTPKPEALEAALRIYPGIASVNSVNGSQESLEAVLPIVKKYGACVIGLTLDENGIPDTVEGRLEIAKRIVDKAKEYGIDKHKVIIDALALTASAQQEQVEVTLETIERLTKELGVATTLGVSNISFGLPQRDIFNSVFLSAALNAGLKMPIINPGSERMTEVIDVFNIINNTDKNSTNYVNKYKNEEKKEQEIESSQKSLKDLVIDGLGKEAAKETTKLLKEKTPEEIINEFFVPALNVVGNDFETGVIFLPQLMQSASAVQSAFEIIKNNTTEENSQFSKGKVLLATVKGDIHDIGKNIVKMMLENYGYDVFDLGSDVDHQKIIEAIKEYDIPLVGLSALMTTTVESMKEVIELIHEENLDVNVVVGGAVLTPEYAKMINADYYASDAQATVDIANKFFEGRNKND